MQEYTPPTRRMEMMIGSYSPVSTNSPSLGFDINVEALHYVPDTPTKLVCHVVIYDVMYFVMLYDVMYFVVLYVITNRRSAACPAPL